MTAKIKLNAASGGGSFSLQAPSSSANNRVFTLPDSADATLLTSTTATGKILQVVQTAKTDTFRHTGNVSVTDITGLNVDITPISSSSKILITVYLNVYNNNISRVQIVRGTTAIGIGDADGIRPRGTMSCNGAGDANVMQAGTMVFLDSPATTSQTNYKVAFSNELNSSVFAVNRSDGDANSIVGVRSISTITAMEVAA
tara:strand:- start:182 stop:781 length:600 start_codon:yes stop_codon:yes gene_type:complete